MLVRNVLVSFEHMEGHAATGPGPVPSLFPDRLAEGVERLAARFVRTWGFTTVTMVSSHLRLSPRSKVSPKSLTLSVLGSMRELTWLDPSREWFSLLDLESPMRTSVEKIYEVAGAVGEADTILALGKRGSFGNAPPRVVAAFVSSLLARVAKQPPFARSGRPTRDEWILIDVLRHGRGVLDLKRLLRASRRFVPAKVATRVLRTSPLFVRVGQGRYRLVGTAN